MSKLDETWKSIEDHLGLYKNLDSLPQAERRQAVMKILVGTRKLQGDVDYFLENAPRGDLRRDMALDLKGLMSKPPGT
jgi:hypothetical protein